MSFLIDEPGTYHIFLSKLSYRLRYAWFYLQIIRYVFLFFMED